MPHQKSAKPAAAETANELREFDRLTGAINPKINISWQPRQGRPHRHHVELRSRDPVPPRQNVAGDHSGKRAPRPARREANAMTAPLRAKFARLRYSPIAGWELPNA